MFTLPKGSKLTPVDFLLALTVVKGNIVAFGTVGVGHIWHLTLKLPDHVELLLLQVKEISHC